MESRVKYTMKSVDLSEILWISWNLVDFGEIPGRCNEIAMNQ